MKLVKLIMPGGDSVWVNPDNITYIRTGTRPTDSSPSLSLINFTSSESIYVKGTAADVVAKIYKTRIGNFDFKGVEA